MPTEEEVKERARAIIAEQLPDAYPDRIEDDTVLADEGNVDSMGFILVLTKLEGEFGATVSDEEWDSLRTLDDVARAIAAHAGDQGDAR